MVTGPETHRGLDHDGVGSGGAVPWRGDGEGVDDDRPQPGLRPRRPVLVLNFDGFEEHMVSEGPRNRAARIVTKCGGCEERLKHGAIAGFLDGCWLEVVEVGEHQILQLRIAARQVDIKCRPGLTQKYL